MHSALRSQRAEPDSTYCFYPINGADQQRDLDLMLGRYRGDVDGDTDAQAGDHPWAVSTANFA